MSPLPENLSTLLTCSSCGQEADHELVYVGRLLHSTRCAACGTVIRHEQRDLMRTYLLDLEHRIVTKPGRLARTAATSPVDFARELPAAVLRQPLKLLAELRTLFR